MIRIESLIIELRILDEIIDYLWGMYPISSSVVSLSHNYGDNVIIVVKYREVILIHNVHYNFNFSEYAGSNISLNHSLALYPKLSLVRILTQSLVTYQLTLTYRLLAINLTKKLNCVTLKFL